MNRLIKSQIGLKFILNLVKIMKRLQFQPEFQTNTGASLTQQLDVSLEKAKIGPELLDSLGKGLNNLAESAKKMSNLSDAAVATNDYATNVKKASTQLR